jgi:AAA15 family ATPase/GTPase
MAGEVSDSLVRNIYVEQNHNFGEIRPRSFGWQLALQSIKSRQNELDLKKIIIIAGPNGAGKTTLCP